ncbi:hypothetical protein M8C21_030138 [Ambrosia artemisiifolia]|uniref:Uncharacterized protein n=1 Tax=Ambrosia artemisiifolia TaxID=4212 RepID=A0AAD5CY76_AMBAR|nr:hypothetical protein M8C21_030138 [Ambrosia artemisiifolia]
MQYHKKLLLLRKGINLLVTSKSTLVDILSYLHSCLFMRFPTLLIICLAV